VVFAQVSEVTLKLGFAKWQIDASMGNGNA